MKTIKKLALLMSISLFAMNVHAQALISGEKNITVQNNTNVPVVVCIQYSTPVVINTHTDEKEQLGIHGMLLDKGSSITIPLPTVYWFAKQGKGYGTSAQAQKTTEVLNHHDADRVIFYIPNTDIPGNNSVKVELDPNLSEYQVTLNKITDGGGTRFEATAATPKILIRQQTGPLQPTIGLSSQAPVLVPKTILPSTRAQQTIRRAGVPIQPSLTQTYEK